MSDRDKRLTEAMGEEWVIECTCGDPDCHLPRNTDFSTWEGFGILKDFIVAQEWLEDFLNQMDVGTYIDIHCPSDFTFDIQVEFIDPDRLANTVDEFLHGGQ